MQKINSLICIITSSYKKAQIYLVGGSVRDKLLNKPLKDYDVVVAQVAAEDLERLLKKHGGVKLVGKAFGVYKWQGEHEIDIALPRAEHGWGTGGRKDFKVQVDHTLPIEQDLARRDFTINAIAYDMVNKVYIDPFCGRDDLKKRLIRTVGKSELRFREDYSRILRGIRFAAQFNFSIHRKTWASIKQNAHNVKEITPEVRAKELIKSLSYNPVLSIKLLEKSGVLEQLVPEIIPMKMCAQPKKWHSEGTVWVHTKRALKELMKKYPLPYDPRLVFAIIFHDVGKPMTKAKQGNRITFYNHHEKGARAASSIISRLRLESGGLIKDDVVWLVKNHMMLFAGDPSKLKNTTVEKYFLSDRHPSELLLKLVECDARATIPQNRSTDKLAPIKVIKKRLKEIKKRPRRPFLDGDEIMSILKIPPGKRVGEIIVALREAELEGEIKSKEEARQYINSKCKMQNFN